MTAKLYCLTSAFCAGIANSGGYCRCLAEGNSANWPVEPLADAYNPRNGESFEPGSKQPYEAM
ncbi:hypothetical protein ACFVYC_01575 [Pseudarthrobacter sp. NPDC058329]|uniref:hypothetical protein n=1 Tax=Pseudarthrobacter sp. NPDC058329 TaxID=3346448 RepID=UPI0036DAF4BE